MCVCMCVCVCVCVCMCVRVCCMCEGLKLVGVKRNRESFRFPFQWFTISSFFSTLPILFCLVCAGAFLYLCVCVCLCVRDGDGGGDG